MGEPISDLIIGIIKEQGLSGLLAMLLGWQFVVKPWYNRKYRKNGNEKQSKNCFADPVTEMRIKNLENGQTSIKEHAGEHFKEIYTEIREIRGDIGEIKGMVTMLAEKR